MSKAHIASRTHWLRKVCTSLTLGALLFSTAAPSASAAFGPRVLVNTENFDKVGSDNPDAQLDFGSSGKRIKYDSATGDFDIDTGLDVTGDVDVTGTVEADTVNATTTLSTDGDLSVTGDTTLGGSVTIGGVEYTFPGSDGSDGDVLTTDSAGNLTWTEALTAEDIDTEAELEAIVGVDFLKGSEIDTIGEFETFLTDVSNVITSGEIDAEAELEALLADVANVITEAEINTEAKLEALANVNFLTAVDVNTQAKLEALLTDATNMIDVGEIDTQAELEAILTDATNLIDIGEINTEAELEAIVGVDFAKIIDFDTEAELEAIVGVDFLKGSEIDTIVEFESFLTDGSDVITADEIDSEAEIEAITGLDIVDASEINTESALESFLSDVTNIFTDNDDTDSITEGVTNLFFTNERVDDRVNDLVVGGEGITVTYDDGADTLTIDRDALADSPDYLGLSPEYDGASYYADGSDNVGQLLIGYDNAFQQNYYGWTSTKAAANDYNIAVRVRVPENFSDWDAAPISFNYKTGNASSAVNNVTMTMLDTDGDAVSLTGAASLANTSWTTASITGPATGGLQTYTPGEYITIIIKMTTTNAGTAQAGYISLNWNVTTP